MLFRIEKRIEEEIKCLTEKEEELNSKLSDEEKGLLATYTNTYNDFLTVSIVDSFISGFGLVLNLHTILLLLIERS